MWVARIQLLPATTTSSILDHLVAGEMADKVVALTAGFLDDGQPGAMSIYSYLMRQIILTINNPGLKILFEPKSLASAKCGDLLVRYQLPESTAEPLALASGSMTLALLRTMIIAGYKSD